MLNTNQIKIGSVVQFELFAEPVLGSRRTNAKVLSILDYTDAQRFIDPPTMHAAVYPDLPSSTPNDFRRYPYLKVLLQSGAIEAIGLPWIREETYTELVVADLQFKIMAVSPTDRARIMNLLSANGYTAVEVTDVS